MFSDIYNDFRLFFNSENEPNPNFLYDLGFGLRPRKYDKSDEEKLILDEEDEVREMYFIESGIVGIGFYLLTQGLSKKQYKLGTFMRSKSIICDYYVCFNKKSEFIFMVLQEVKAYSISKKFLQDEIFPKYPVEELWIKRGSFDRYKRAIRSRLLKYRSEHINEVNKKSSYKSIKLSLKTGFSGDVEKGGSMLSDVKISEIQESSAISMAKTENDLNEILKNRIDVIQSEMERFNSFIVEFAETADLELLNVVGNVNLLHRNMDHAKNIRNIK